MARNRDDAIRIKDLDGFHTIVPYLMPKRTEAEVSLTEHFDVTDLMNYLHDRNEKEETELKFFHAFCTAIARTIYLRPQMNVFISGKHFWQRKEISLSFVAKRKFEDYAEESLMFLTAKPELNLDEISKIIVGDVDKARKSGGTDVDGTLDSLAKLPRFLLRIIFWWANKMEYYGIMPRSLRRGDPNYSSVLLSNLGSIGAGAPYHHLSEYGTCSIMITIGTIHKELVTAQDGTQSVRDCVDATFILDERIADGFYFAKSLRITKYILEHPTCLTESISTPVPVEL